MAGRCRADDFADVSAETQFGIPGDDLAPGTLESILKRSGLMRAGGFMRYVIVGHRMMRGKP